MPTVAVSSIGYVGRAGTWLGNVPFRHVPQFLAALEATAGDSQSKRLFPLDLCLFRR